MNRLCGGLLSLILISTWTNTIAEPPAVARQLEQYRAQGAGPFDAERGKAFWEGPHRHAGNGETRRCTQCHGMDPRRPGKHRRTGKVIGPMAPSVNPKRFTDTRKIEKWFKRNCKWTLGRLCTAQEKGDVLTYLARR